MFIKEMELLLTKTERAANLLDEERLFKEFYQGIGKEDIARVMELSYETVHDFFHDLYKTRLTRLDPINYTTNWKQLVV